MRVSGIALIAIPILLGVVLHQVMGYNRNTEPEPVAAGGHGGCAPGPKNCFQPQCGGSAHKRSSSPELEPSDANQVCTHIRTNPKMASIFALLLIAFSFIVELILHRIEHLFHEKPQIMKIVQAIYNELMLLGLIAIMVFVLKQSGVADKISQMMACNLVVQVAGPGPKDEFCTRCCPHDIEELFEKVHLGVSATMGIYFISCLYLVLLHWIIYKHWIAIDFEPFDRALYNKTLEEHNNASFMMRYLHLPRRLRMWRLHGIDRIHALRASCIEQYGLPQDFQFSKYFKLSMRDVVIHVLEVHPLCWAVLVLGLVLTLLRLVLGMRVSNSDRSMAIYGGLSAAIALLSGGIYFFASRIYRKVLALPSVKRHLLTAGATGDDPSPVPNADFANPDQAVALDDDGLTGPTAGLSSATSSHDDFDSVSMKSIRPTSSSWSYVGSGQGAEVLVDKTQDQVEHSFEDTVPGKQLHFQVFKRHGQTLALMSVDDYRVHSTRVRNILTRAASPTIDDDEHKSKLFFRSTKFLVLALQIVTFLQTWALGLSIYFLYSIYRDQPTQPPRYPITIAFLFFGPLVTYGLMGPTLAKLVKATYTGGLVRPELILEALFQPKSRIYQADPTAPTAFADRSSMVPRSYRSPVPTNSAQSVKMGTRSRTSVDEEDPDNTNEKTSLLASNSVNSEYGS